MNKVLETARNILTVLAVLLLTAALAKAFGIVVVRPNEMTLAVLAAATALVRGAV
jgi:hypothetical protein